MPKMKNVTRADIQSLREKTDDAISEIWGISDRMEKGYVDDIESPIDLVRHFNALSRAASTMVSALLIKAHLQEQKAEIERMIRQRIKDDA